MVRFAEGGKGVRIGRKTLTGLGAAVVAGALAAYLLIADPFAGPLPDGWKRYDLGDRVGVAVAVPEGFVKNKQPADSDGTVASFTDPSGLVSVEVNRDLKAEDTDGAIEGSASERAFAHWEELRDGEYSWGIARHARPEGQAARDHVQGPRGGHEHHRLHDDDRPGDGARGAGHVLPQHERRHVPAVDRVPGHGLLRRRRPGHRPYRHRLLGRPPTL
ncbi:hypothetical protein SALBM217S_03155 [Streptomyces griseoloalbus]